MKGWVIGFSVLAGPDNIFRPVSRYDGRQDRSTASADRCRSTRT